MGHGPTNKWLDFGNSLGLEFFYHCLFVILIQVDSYE